jgi:phosphatidylserine/phosphatidylglycerophosphate/cardiolipin synthase-like enzyme
MRLLKFNTIKSEILKLIGSTRKSLLICSYSVEITNIEILEFINLIERGAKIQLILGKELPTEIMAKLSRLYNIGVYHLPSLHAKIYLNEEEAIISSCNFGRLTLQKLIECGIQFSKKDYRPQHVELEEQVRYFISQAVVRLPVLPFEPDNTIDLKELLL